jgi:hypothetical protein
MLIGLCSLQRCDAIHYYVMFVHVVVLERCPYARDPSI